MNPNLPDSLKAEGQPARKTISPVRCAALVVALFGAFAGCQAPESAIPVQQGSGQTEAQTIREGDVLKISFPGSPNLDSSQQVRRDGRITLEIIGDVSVVGLTSAALEKDLIQRFSSQLVSKEVTVTIVSSSFSVFVTGAVLKPGKFNADHPITVLEAVMEAGGFDLTKANMEAVVVIRQESGGTKNYNVNLKLVLEGKSTVPFYLKPSDIVYVPEKFTWF
jgi:polysaccharide export outer membrane protein